MKNNVIAILVVLAVIMNAAAYSNVDVTNTIKKFMLTLYSNDKAGYESVILPNEDSDQLLGRKTLTAEELAKVNDDVSKMRLVQTGSYSHKAGKIEPDKDGKYPDNTMVTFMTQFRGVNLAIPLLKTED